MKTIKTPAIAHLQVGSDGGFAGLKGREMIEYKVGKMVYVETDRYHGNFIGYAEIITVGRIYAEAAIGKTRIKINMGENRVCSQKNATYVAGYVYASKGEYDEKRAIQKFAEKIKNTVNNLGYGGFRECNMEELRKIADILKINLDE